VTASRWHLPAGSTADGPIRAQVTPDAVDWNHTSLRVVDLPPGAEHDVVTHGEEMLVLPLAGAATVTCDGATFELAGRPGVFVAVSDFVYLPREAHAVVASEGGGRFALPGARCGSRLEARYGATTGIGIELRGAGASSRQVNDICMPATFAAERLLVCEVLTPAGNWSSYPPHKHDDARAGESALEEIYYFEIAPGPTGGSGTGFQRVYGPGIDVLAEVRDGDVVLVPYGWHGPSVASPGYDMYYLNVMAGPGPERAWKISTDPDHAWIREAWASMLVDPRLPMTGGRQ
jgi:5-deoxy-glucuronate isomerase